MQQMRQAHPGKLHAIGVALSEPQARRFPNVMDAARGETEQLCADCIGRNGIGADDHQTGLESVSADWPDADHCRMSDGDRELRRKALRHRRDE